MTPIKDGRELPREATRRRGDAGDNGDGGDGHDVAGDVLVGLASVRPLPHWQGVLLMGWIGAWLGALYLQARGLLF